jgi:hypothetical protein
MKTKFLSADPINGTLHVEFFTDADESLGSSNIAVPVENGKFITGAKLEYYISTLAPTGLERRVAEVKTADNFAEIQALVQPE